MTETIRTTRIAFRVNGKDHELDVPPMSRLLDVLRERIGLTGTKEGCGEGECGACSVMLNGELVNSCLVPIAQVNACEVGTIDGLELDGCLDSVQEAFLKHGGAQCGICTPGMVLAAKALLDSNPEPSESEVRTALAGNLCRCTGYTRIFESVLAACRQQ